MPTKHNYILILLVYSGILFTVFLGALPADIMEARNFTTALEMIENNNWLIPTMNGELRLTKPPFPTWVTALWGKVVGFESEALLRLPSALIGMLLVFFLYRTIDLIGKDRDQAMMGGLVAASSFYIFLMSRTGSWDIYCHAFMLVAIYFLLKAFKSYFKTKPLIWCGVFLGLSALSKGPVAFYAFLLPFIIAYLIAYGYKDFKIVGWRWVLVLLPFVLISFAWPFYTYLNVPDEAFTVASKESSNWLNYNVRPFYYYWSFPIQTGVWTLVLVVSLAYPFMIKRVEDPKAYRLAFFWTILSVVLLSLIPEKKSRYLLPVLIPAAWTISFYYRVLRDMKKPNVNDLWIWQVNKGLFSLLSFGIAALVMYLLLGGELSNLQNRIAFSWPTGLAMVFCFIVIGVSLFKTKFRERADHIFYSPLLLMLFASIFVMPKLEQLLYTNESYRSPYLLHTQSEYSDLDFATSRNSLRIEMVWQARKKIPYIPIDQLHKIEKKTGVFSSHPVKEILCEGQIERLVINQVDRFDINRKLRKENAGTNDLDQYFSIVTPK